MTVHEKLIEKFSAAQTPGYAIRKIENGKIVFDDFGGIRALDHSTRITKSDLWHIGSCTKSMTSFLIGMLVDEGKISFDDQIGKILNNSIVDDLKKITVLDLLTHRSGLAEITELKNLNWSSFVQSKESIEKLRCNLVNAILSETKKFLRDSNFEYCNSNYLILGAILEQAHAKSWEQIISEKIFVTLGMNDCGFGPPATKDLIPPDQPWGHKLINDVLTAVPPKEKESEPSDNPAALGPAGTVHCSFDSWSLFLQEMLLSAQGKSTLLKSSTAKALFNLHRDNIAGGGWGLIERDWAQGPTYTMI